MSGLRCPCCLRRPGSRALRDRHGQLSGDREIRRGGCGRPLCRSHRGARWCRLAQRWLIRSRRSQGPTGRSRCPCPAVAPAATRSGTSPTMSARRMASGRFPRAALRLPAEQRTVALQASSPMPIPNRGFTLGLYGRPRLPDCLGATRARLAQWEWVLWPQEMLKALTRSVTMGPRLIGAVGQKIPPPQPAVMPRPARSSIQEAAKPVPGT